MRHRRVILSSLAIGFAAALAACGLATKGSEPTAAAGCTQGCSSDDAGPGDTKDGGFAVEAGAEGGSFNALCGAGCNADPASAIATCADTSGSGTQGHADPGQKLGCQVVRGANGAAIATCVKVGTGADGEPCQSPSDCSPGMTCITETDEATTNAGRCRPYCCGETTTCAAGTYCSDLHLFEPTVVITDRLFLPVCAPATNCKLLESGQCDGDQACVLVNDKTTSCQSVGVGVAGDGCPCAADYYCVKKTLTCKKLCHVGADAQCGDGTCESGSAFPDGFGICIGS